MCIVLGSGSFAQKKNLTIPEQKELQKQFPDEELIATEEVIRYSFKPDPDLENESGLIVEENYRGSLFTTQNNYEKLTSVFYDDYSKVKNVICKQDGRALPLVALLNTNYQSAGIFHDDVKLCLFNLKMQKNSKYEIAYTKENYSPRHLSKVYFNVHFPVAKKKVIFEIPDWAEVEIKEFNFEGYTIKKSENRPNGKKYRELIYEMTKAEASPDENNAPNFAKFMPHMLVFLKSYTLPKKSQQVVFKTHDDVYKWCKKLVDEVKNDDPELKTVAKELAGSETDSLKIMQKVFYWVQDHVRYIAFEDGIMGYKPMDSKKVYNMLYGDCKGMANFTKTLLKNLGFDARLTWIGTTDIPYNNDLPCLSVYNHMICAVFLNGKKYYLDATEDFIALDDYAERIQGRPVMIENGNSYITETIPSYTYERNKKDFRTELSVNNEGDLQGTCNYVFNGEGKTNFLRRVAALKTENKSNAIRNFLKDNNPNLTVTNVKTSDLLDRGAPLNLSCDILQKNAGYKTSNNELLLLPEKDFDFENFDFDSIRKTDYEFRNKLYLSYSTNIALPAGATVKTMPAPVKISNDLYEFDLKVTMQGGKMNISKVLILKNSILPKKAYKQWNEDIKLLRKFYREPIIVKLK